MADTTDNPTGDEVFRLVREALDATMHAGYVVGRWVSNEPHVDAGEYGAAKARARETTAAMWRALYDMAGQ